MKIILGKNAYLFLKGYQKKNQYRAAFNKVAKRIFGISFEAWYQAGYWNEKYIPYTLFDAERAVANVSVNIMDFNVLGEQKRYIQLGTVLTDKDYRNQHLNRFLMETVSEEWREKCDFIYLFANKSVLNFYPKFGFQRFKEYEYFKIIEKNVSHKNLEKLNMDVQSNRDKLYDYIKNSMIFSKIALRNNPDLVMFYCILDLKENVYYIKSLDIIVIATFNKNQLHLWDVYSPFAVELDKIIDTLIDSKINQVVLGFTPLDCQTYKVREIRGDDILFIQKDKTQLFHQNKIMFLLLSHA